MKYKARLGAFVLVLILILGIIPFAYATQEREPSQPQQAQEAPAPSIEQEETNDPDISRPTIPEIPPSKSSNPNGHVYKSGVVWSSDSSKEFDATFNSITYHIENISLYSVKYNGSYVPCYCIAPGMPLGSGSPYEKDELTTTDAWISLTEGQRKAIGLALIYGYPNSINPSSALDQKGAQAATQMIVWEICYGMRKASAPFTCTDTRFIDLFNSDSKGNQFTDGAYGTGNGMVYNLKSCYQQISNAMAQHFKVPSFMSTDAATAQIFDMTQNANGTYSVTLTDSNNMLSGISFEDTDVLTFKKSGNTLTITAYGPIPEITVRVSKNVPHLEKQTFIVWTHTDKQPVVQALAPTNDPTPLYLKLRIRIGNLTIKKTTSDGKMLGGWEFRLYSDEACTNQLYGPYVTALDGTITATNIAVGEYWIKEVGNTDPAVTEKYKCEGENPQKITVTAGTTTSVVFENVLKNGSVKLIKQTNTGENLVNWKIGIYTDFACTNAIEGSPFVTGEDGTITVPNLHPGNYYAKEIGNTDPEVTEMYKCEGENPQKITVTAGTTTSVVFENVLKNGSVKLIKQTNTGENLANWKIGIYTDFACTNAIEGSPFVTGKDGTITVPNLRPGNYYAKEIDESEQYPGWTFDTAAKKIVIKAGQTTTVTFLNYFYGEITVQKVNQDGKALYGAEFLLEWSKDGKAWQPVFHYRGINSPEGSCSNNKLVDGKLTTGKGGTITWERLHTHLFYRVTEISAPDGYVLLTEPAFEGKLPKEEPFVTLRVVNAHQFVLPQTGSDALSHMPFALAFCVIICVTSLYCLKKKKPE